LGQATSNRYPLAAILDANLPAYAVMGRIVRGSQRQITQATIGTAASASEWPFLHGLADIVRHF